MRLFGWFRRPRRLAIRFVSYREAEMLLKDGWTIAKEEDTNTALGYVYLERLEKP